MKFAGFFTSHAFSDDEGRKTAKSLLSIMLIAALASLPVIFTFRRIYDPKFFVADYTILFLLVIYSGLYLLLRKGRIRFVSLHFIVLSWVALTIMAVRAVGIKDVAVMGYILSIFLSVLLIGYRMAIIMSVATILSVWMMAIAENRDLLIPPIDPPLPYAFDLTVMILLVVTGIVLFDRSFRYSFKRINEELARKKEAEKKLSENRDDLIRKNQDLLEAKVKAEESDRLKSAFLHNISLEIHIPVTGITSLARNMKSRQTDTEKTEMGIKSIISYSEQMADIINDLIDISKIEAGAVEISISEFDLSELLNETNSLFQKLASEKRIHLNIQNTLGNVVVRTDKVKLARVLNNLIDNALTYTLVGEVRLSISGTFNSLKVIVSDTGPGIHQKDLPFIFDRFWGHRRNIIGATGRTGLGLAICKANIDLLGGKISVRSEFGTGSDFEFEIPVEFTTPATSKLNVFQEIISTGRIKILIAEDDDVSFLFLKQILKPGEFDLIRVSNGVAAISEFNNQPDIGLVLLDLKMPEMSGFEVVRRIRSSGRRIPVIAVTAYAFEDDRKKAFEAGVDDYVTKPVDRIELLSKVRKYLAMKK